jgi:hypothetical protein
MVSLSLLASSQEEAMGIVTDVVGQRKFGFIQFWTIRRPNANPSFSVICSGWWYEQQQQQQ